MLYENLVNIRKNKGFSQAYVALQLHVVRQTISKWEKGLSVPDAQMLMKLSEIYEVTPSVLLGETMEEETSENEVAKHLGYINESLMIKNRRTKRIIQVIVGILVCIFISILMMILIGRISLQSYEQNTKAEVVEIPE